MTYATQAQLTGRFGEATIRKLTDRATPPEGEIDGATVAQALADTDATIDGYLLGRYRLPLAETPPLVVDLALSIAFYKLHTRAPDEKVKDDYDRALRMLDNIAKGIVRLNVEGAEPASSGATGVRASDRARDLTPDNLKGFV